MVQHDTATDSPCVRICQLDDRGVCIGCLRTLDEIAHWSEMDSATRRRLLAELDRRRAALAL